MAFTGLTITFALVRLGLTLESPGLIAGALAAAAIAVGALPNLSDQGGDDASLVRIIGRRILACAGCAAVLYFLSFWIALCPLMRAPVGDKNWRLFCRVYKPMILMCPRTVLDSYTMYAGGLSDMKSSSFRKCFEGRTKSANSNCATSREIGCLADEEGRCVINSSARPRLMNTSNKGPFVRHLEVFAFHNVGREVRE